MYPSIRSHFQQVRNQPTLVYVISITCISYQHKSYKLSAETVAIVCIHHLVQDINIGYTFNLDVNGCLKAYNMSDLSNKNCEYYYH